MTAPTFGDPVAIATARPVRGYQAQRARLTELGLHPTGRPLAGDDHPGHGHTCGDCRRHYIRQFADRYHKCELIPATSGPASDIKVRWPACDQWSDEDQDEQ